MSEEFLSNETVVVEFLDKVGNLKEKESDLLHGVAVGKVITTTRDDQKSVKYKLVIYNGALYQPSGPYSTREKGLKQHFVFRVVSKPVFDNYVQFLKTKKNIYYIQANREITNG